MTIPKRQKSDPGLFVRTYLPENSKRDLHWRLHQWWGANFHVYIKPTEDFKVYYIYTIAGAHDMYM